MMKKQKTNKTQLIALLLACLLADELRAQDGSVVEAKSSEWITVRAVPVAKKATVRKKAVAVARTTGKAPVQSTKPPAAFDRTNQQVNRFRKPKQ